MTGRIHSIQTMGAVDGPGLRGVVFMQGCPLRCAYCHNPDTWSFEGGQEIAAEDLCKRLLRYRTYYKNGGVTVSGGEPLMQSEFVGELFSLLQKEGLHTALDTSGMASLEAARRVLPHTDLVLCDIKFPTEDMYRAHTGVSMQPMLDFLSEVERTGVPFWVRHVVVPGLTDSDEEVLSIHRIAKQFKGYEKLELLPFKKLCLTKYQAMNLPFPLADTPECPPERIQALYRMLDSNA